MVDITFHSIDKENLKIGETSALFGDVVLFVSPLLDDSDELEVAIPKINAIFDDFATNTNFSLLYCVVSRDFIIRNHNISHKQKSPA